MKLPSAGQQKVPENDSNKHSSSNVERTLQEPIPILSRESNQLPENSTSLQEDSSTEEQPSICTYHERNSHDTLQGQTPEEETSVEMRDLGEVTATSYAQNPDVLTRNDSQRDIGITATSVDPMTTQYQDLSNSSYAPDTNRIFASSNECTLPEITSSQGVMDPPTTIIRQPRGYASLEYVTHPPHCEPLVQRDDPPPTYEEATGISSVQPAIYEELPIFPQPSHYEDEGLKNDCSSDVLESQRSQQKVNYNRLGTRDDSRSQTAQNRQPSQPEPISQPTPVSDSRTNYVDTECLEALCYICVCCIICCDSDSWE